MFLIYNLLFPLLLLFYLPFYLVHIVRRGGLTKDIWERFGFFPAEIKARLRQLERPTWIHAVSVGETMEAISFIQVIRQRNPKEPIVFSCGTSTGFATAKKKLPQDVVAIYCPMDVWWMMWHAIRLIRPKLLMILEVEIWPNLIRMTKSYGAKVVLVNGRLSDRSSHNYAKFRWIFKSIFRCFDGLYMQTAEDIARLQKVIGEDPRIHAVGTVKFDQTPDCDQDNSIAEALDSAFGTAPRVIFCAGSTHGGEETPIIQAFKEALALHPQLRMILVPRHAERGPEVAKLLNDAQIPWISALPIDGTTPAPAGTAKVYLGNTTGQLMKCYAASDICFVGKSLEGQNGGHNIIEPAIFGKALLYGPHMENFRQVDAIFQAENAGVVLKDNQQLLKTLDELLANPEKCRELGRSARAVVDKHRGAIQRTLKLIDALPQ